MTKKNFNKDKAGETGKTGKGIGELPEAVTQTDDDVLVNYNIRYSRNLQKKIKRFCIEHDGIDMRDVFIQGAMMYMESK